MSINNQNHDPRYADLHLHTNASDGAWNPSALVDAAVELGFSAIAVSDHDTVAGLDEAIRRAEQRGLELITAVELSAGLDIGEVHVLGYFIDHNSPALKEKLSLFRDYREQRVGLMIAKLQNLGMKADIDEFTQQYQGRSMGRLHLAQYLVNKKFVSGIKEAFSQYLGFKKPAYAPKYNLSPKEACQLINQAGGVAILAHPHLLDGHEILNELSISEA